MNERPEWSGGSWEERLQNGGENRNPLTLTTDRRGFVKMAAVVGGALFLGNPKAALARVEESRKQEEELVRAREVAKLISTRPGRWNSRPYNFDSYMVAESGTVIITGGINGFPLKQARMFVDWCDSIWGVSSHVDRLLSAVSFFAQNEEGLTRKGYHHVGGPEFFSDGRKGYWGAEIRPLLYQKPRFIDGSIQGQIWEVLIHEGARIATRNKVSEKLAADRVVIPAERRAVIDLARSGAVGARGRNSLIGSFNLYVYMYGDEDVVIRNGK